VSATSGSTSGSATVVVAAATVVVGAVVVAAAGVVVVGAGGGAAGPVTTIVPPQVMSMIGAVQGQLQLTIVYSPGARSGTVKLRRVWRGLMTLLGS